MRFLRLLFILIPLVSPLISISAHASLYGDTFGLSPFWDWKTLETPHFRVTFPSRLEPTARKAAEYLEQAHQILTKKLYWQPRQRTQITIVDNTDLANGQTDAALRFGIVLQVTPPDSSFSTIYYDDWLKLLTFHEYTHLVNMDATTDWVEALRLIFGDVIRPNVLWPRWMLEGLAVYMETRLTGAGRGRSPYFEMILRTAVEDGTLGTSRFMTLDKLQGPNPYNPAGDTAYLFGYELMNQVAKGSGEDALGAMSIRSGGRVPFFINGNLENVSGKDWFQYWDDFVAETKTRMEKQLRTIRSQPLTPTENLSPPAVSILGSTISPDGHWIAYTQDSSDQWMGLYLRDLRTGQTTRIGDKNYGSGMAFTPDSGQLIYSSIEAHADYNLYNDLAIYDLQKNQTWWLTSGARFRDPSLSQDGKRAVFVATHDESNSIEMADLLGENGSWRLGPPETVYRSARFDNAANPKFSPDGRSVVFSFSKNGIKGTQILSVDLEEKPRRAKVVATTTGYQNHFPAFGPSGRLYFVSDRTGVDNVYRVNGSGAEQITNVTTGIWFPDFPPTGPEDHFYASVYSTPGWTLSKVSLGGKTYRSSELTVDSPPAPNTEPVSDSIKAEAAEAVRAASVSDYSAWPTLWPRQWSPYILAQSNRIYAGGEVLGFDALDDHEYALFAAYDTLVKKTDWLAQYANRDLGPTIELQGSYMTTAYVASGADLIYYRRKASGTVQISYPLKFTYSTLTPIVGAHADHEFSYFPPNTTQSAFAAAYVPSAEVALQFSDTESSRLAVTPEAGRTLLGGVRRYFTDSTSVYKGLFSYNEYLNPFGHVVLSPSVATTWTSKFSPYGTADASVAGRTGAILNSSNGLTARTFDTMRIRGYEGVAYFSQLVNVGALDVSLPLKEIFRGLGTEPLFFNNLYMTAFAEDSWFPPTSFRGSIFLPSAGGSLRLQTTLLTSLPVTFSLEFHHGFNQQYGGDTEVFFNMISNSLNLTL